MGFNDFISFEPAPMSAFDRLEEVDSLAREKIALRLQEGLRTTIDPGVDLKSAMRAQKIRVTSEEGRLVVHQEDQAAIIGGGDGDHGSDSDPNTVTNFDELFEPSSGVPSIGPDGRLIYRTVSPAVMLGEQRAEADQMMADQTVNEILSNNLVDAYDDAFREIGERK
jgi:hypothetical protein